MELILISIVFLLTYFIRGGGFSHKAFKVLIRSWLVVLFLSFLNIYKLYDMSFHVFILFSFFILFYFIGFFSIKNKFSEKLDLYKINESSMGIYNNYIFKYLSALFLGICIYYSYRFLNIYQGLSDISEVRSIKYEIGGLFINGYSAAIYNYFVGALIWFYKFTLAFTLVFGIRKYLTAFLFSILICLSYYFVGGGRNIVIEIIAFYIFLDLLKNSCIKITFFKILFKYLILLFFGSLSFVMGTYLRLSNNELSKELLYNLFQESFDQILIYITGSFRALDYAINNYNNLFYGFGLYTFSSIEELFLNFLFLFGFEFKPTNYEVGEILREPILIGNGQSFNALYTGIFPFYFDFGIIGIIIFSLLLGVISRYFINLYLRKQKLTELFLMLSFIQISLFMFMTFKLNPGFLLIILIFLFLSFFRKVKVKV